MTNTLTWLLAEVVVPSLASVVPDDAVELIEVAAMENPYSAAGMTDAVGLRLRVNGEVFQRDIYAPEVFVSAADSRDRLISDLADFVAESRFGWGQKRD